MNPTQQAALRRFLIYLRAERNVSVHTIRAYRADYKDFFAFCAAHYPGLPLNQVSKVIIRAYMASLSGRNRSTITRHCASLKTFFRYLVQEELVDRDPTVTLRFPKKHTLVPEVLSEEEIEKLLEWSATIHRKGALRNRAMIEVLYSSSARFLPHILTVHFESACSKINCALVSQ